MNTDEWVGYKGITNLYKHTVVKHGQGEYVRGVAYTNNIECFWSILKRGIFGIYHFTSKKHLQAYIDEFVFRYNYNTRDYDTSKVYNLIEQYGCKNTL